MMFLPLASSSKGNAYLVSGSDATILLEAGLTMKELRKRSPVQISSLDAAFITHEHMDHAKCVKKLCDIGVPVYMSEGTAIALDLEEANIMEQHETVEVGSLRITAFDTYHNTAQPFGYAIEDANTKVYGYGYTTSSSSWGGSSTTVHAFCGDGYYKSSNWGSPSKTSCTFDVSDGKLTGLPSLDGGTLIAVCGL